MRERKGRKKNEERRGHFQRVGNPPALREGVVGNGGITFLIY